MDWHNQILEEYADPLYVLSAEGTQKRAKPSILSLPGITYTKFDIGSCSGDKSSTSAFCSDNSSE